MAGKNIRSRSVPRKNSASLNKYIEGLKESEKYRIFVENAADPIFMVDRRCRILYANAASGRMVGKNPASFEGVHIGRLFSSDVGRSLVRNLRAVFRRGKGLSIEGRLVAGGKEMWVGSSHTPVRNRAGRIVAVAGIVRDYSRLKQAEARIRQSEKRFHDLAANANEWIWEVDAKGRYTYSSPAVRKMLGYRPDELVRRKHFYDFFPKKGRQEKANEVMRGFAAKRPFRNFINKNLHRNGKVVWLSTSGVPVLGKNGALLGYRGMDLDITRQKKAEEELLLNNALLKAQSETSMDGMLVVNSEGRTLMANRSFGKVWRIPREIAETKNDKKRLRFVLGALKYPDKFIAKVNYLYAHPGEKSCDEVEFRDGRILDRYSSPLIDSDGRNWGRVWYFHDITLERKARESLANQKRELERMVRERTAALKLEIKRARKLAIAKDEFLRSVTHDLKTPLSVILMSIPAMKQCQKQRDCDRFEELAGLLDRNAARLRNSIENILELSRIGALTQYRKESIDLRKMVAEVADVYAPLAREKGVDFLTDVPPITLKGDPAVLPYALSNLVSNAVKFTEKGSVVVKARETAGFVEITVMDTGVGMSEENQKHAFEKFFKASPTAPGTGVGLALVKEIIEGHGGSVELKSRLGRGTTVKAILPKSGKRGKRA